MRTCTDYDPANLKNVYGAGYGKHHVHDKTCFKKEEESEDEDEDE